MPSTRAGRAVLAAGLLAGAEARRRHRRGDRGAHHAALARLDDRGRAVPRRAGAERSGVEDPRRTGPRRVPRRAIRRTPRRPKVWNSDWALGPPDLVLKVGEPYTRRRLPGRMSTASFVIPSGLTEGRWIAAADFKPGNMKVVHHILAAYDVTGNARKLDAADPGPGYATSGGGYGRLPSGLPFLPSGQLWGWAPGRTPEPIARGHRPRPAGRRRRPAPGPLPQERQARDRRHHDRPLFRQGARRQADPIRRRDARRDRGSSAGPSCASRRATPSTR